MFSVTKIASLYGAVGTRQPFNVASVVIDADNLASRSGLFVTDNPLCKVDALKATQDYKDITDADFNLILKRMQQDSISTIANAVFSESDFIDRQVLYPNAMNRVNTVTLPSGFVGEWIQVSGDNVAFEITRIILDFDGAGDLDILLFNTSETAPILSETVTITANHQVIELNWKVDNSGNTYKGDYYLGYLTNTVGYGTLKPFARDYNLSNVRSGVCNMSLQSVKFLNHTTATIPDLTTREGLSESHGMNPDVTVYYDYTDLILQNESLFYQAINVEFQIKFLTSTIASLRINGDQRKTAELLSRMTIEVSGLDSEGHAKVRGLRPLQIQMIKTIRAEIKRLNENYFGGMIKVYTMS